MAKVLSITGLQCDGCDAAVECDPAPTKSHQAVREMARTRHGWERCAPIAAYSTETRKWAKGYPRVDLCAPCFRKWRFDFYSGPLGMEGHELADAIYGRHRWVCRATDCSRRVQAKGWCSTHYGRTVFHGGEHYDDVPIGRPGDVELHKRR